MPPHLLHLGPLHLPLFGLFAAAGIIAALSLSQRTARPAGLTPEALWDAGMAAVFSAYLISRALLLVENLRSFLAYPLLLLTVPSLTASGLLLTGLLMAVYLRRKGLPLLATMDAFAPPAALLWAVLSVGDFAAGDREGMPTALAWGLRTPLGRVHPVELYAAVAALALCAGLLWGLRRRHRPGRVFAQGLMAAGLLMFLLDFVRLPAPLTGLALLDPNQWLAVAMVVAGGLLEVMMPQRTEPAPFPQAEDDVRHTEPAPGSRPHAL